jgi:3-oxoacyl-(acyl-carrier-protein) synthase
MTGHSLGGAGVQELIYSLIMMKERFVAPSINIEKLDPLAYGVRGGLGTTQHMMCDDAMCAFSRAEARAFPLPNGTTTASLH